MAEHVFDSILESRESAPQPKARRVRVLLNGVKLYVDPDTAEGRSIMEQGEVLPDRVS